MATVDLPCHGYGFGSTVAWNRERSITWISLPRLEHESDEGIQIFSPEVAEALVEAMIAACVKNPKEASAMRRAVRGEPIGERDPNQLGLFGEEDL
jgi:hypothetical protein